MLSHRPRPRVGIIDEDPDFRLLVVELVEEVGGEAVALSADDLEHRILEDQLAGLVIDWSAASRGEVIDIALRNDVPYAISAVLDTLFRCHEVLSQQPHTVLRKSRPASEVLDALGLFVSMLRSRLVVSILEEGFDQSNQLVERLVGSSPAIHRIVRRLPRIALSSSFVCISGPRGSGKSLVRKLLHALGPRSAEPLHRLTARGKDLPDDGLLLPALREADGGIVEIGDVEELSLGDQAKLVDHLRRLRTNEAVFDTRVYATSTAQLSAAAQAGVLRPDLYTFVEETRIDLPPLELRRGDIPYLAQFFLEEAIARGPTSARAFTPEALEALTASRWDDHVAGLRRQVFRGVDNARSALVGLDALGLEPPLAPDESALPFHDRKGEAIARFERAYVRDLIRRHQGNVAAAARSAGLDRRSLSRLLARHGLSVGDLLS
ncbi:MAG: sigma 54-interacting transcriptional regulator [Myxococcota bacterium]